MPTLTFKHASLDIYVLLIFTSRSLNKTEYTERNKQNIIILKIYRLLNLTNSRKASCISLSISGSGLYKSSGSDDSSL